MGASGRGRYFGFLQGDIRSGGREQEAMSVKAVEFLEFNRDRILRVESKCFVREPGWATREGAVWTWIDFYIAREEKNENNIATG